MALVFFIVLLCTTGCGSKSPVDALVVGLECDYAPFNWTTSTETSYTEQINGLNGYYSDGYDIQIAKYLGKELGVPVVIKKIAWEALVPALNVGDINVIIAGMSYTEDRDLSVDFTNSYYTSEMVGIVRKNSGLTTITSIQQLSGKKVVSQLGTIQNDVIDQINGVVHMTPVDSFNTAAFAVSSTDADAMIAEYPVAQAICNANTSLTMVRFTTQNFTGLDENELSVAIAVKEGNSKLKVTLNEALAKLDGDTRNKMMSEALSRSTAGN